MPRQGNTVESCVITNWKVKEGDDVSAGTAICEVETDKAVFEIPAGADGTVLKLLYTSGDDVPVLEPIAVIGEPSEDWQSALSGNISHEGTEHTSNQRFAAQREDKSELRKENPNSSFLIPNSSFPTPHSSFSISPRARKLAEKEKVTVTFSGSGPGGRVIERDVVAALQNRPPLTAAAKAAGQGTVPPQGTGLGGRITIGDLTQSSLFPSPHSLVPDPQSPVPDAFGDCVPQSPVPIKGIRKIIADRMTKSLAETAQFTLNASAQAVKLQLIRSGLKTHGITINDLVLFGLSRSLTQFPYMNAHKIGETIRMFERVHLGMAVDTERGLMVPVIRNADQLSLARISSEAKRLATACQAGSVNPDELSGSTFTVSNLGSLGITSFTPVLNIPEVAILGVCGLEMKGYMTDDGISFVPHIGFSLTINHQVVDGAPAAKFLKGFCDTIAAIDLLLV